MPYDHSRKIGNQGDLAKHPVLCACLDTLLAQLPNGRPFAYAETHTGRAEYVLPEGGEWNQGIGEFASSIQVKADRKLRRNHKPSTLGHLGTFDEQFIGQEMGVGMRYPGSSGIAFQRLRASGRAFTMRLWDIEQPVVDDLTRHFLPWRQVTAELGNGYTAVADEPQANLVLIDPPSPDTANVVGLIRRLSEVKTPFIAWVPRSSYHSKQNDTTSEAKTSLEFREQAARAGASVIGVQWSEWGARVPGCWLAVDVALGGVVHHVLSEVVKVMQGGWRVTEVEPATRTEGAMLS